MRAAYDVGPDLTDAVDDVPARYDQSLEEFLAHPGGIMQFVLRTQVRLTRTERDSVVALLVGLAAERRRQPLGPLFPYALNAP